MKKYDIIVIGGSAGAISGIETILKEINSKCSTPIIFLVHLGEILKTDLTQLFSKEFRFNFKEAENYEAISEGWIYFAPPLYHLQIEKDRTFSLSIDEKVNYSRPSIDVLFETAAEVYHNRILGVILSGASSDGAKGAKRIEILGGDLIIENPKSITNNIMPNAAMRLLINPIILNANEIGEFINKLEEVDNE